MSNQADVVKLIAPANETIQATDTFARVFALSGTCGAASDHYNRNPKAEDMVFHIKQVFECIQSAHSTTPTFKDYHTVRSFTGTVHHKHDKRAAAVLAAIAVVTTPAESAPAKTPATSGKAKASKAPAKRSHCLAKSRATIEDLSDAEVSVVAATKEDMVMGNPDAQFDFRVLSQATSLSSVFELAEFKVPHRFAPVLQLGIILHRVVCEVFLKSKQLHALLKFLKNKKAAQRGKEKAERHAEAIQAAEATIAKGKAIAATNQARKRPRISTDHAFKDSPYTIAAADLAINNEASQSTIDAAASLVVAGDHINPSESVLHSREADLRNNVIATTHKIEHLLKYREFVVAHHGQVIKQLESRLPVPMEADSSAPVASGSKIN
ncbi:uncharacterized protein ARMOST_22474 [Armillaria ostoyae]|uniref:Uncharacterized protein n=1 Tax=Armillaria ostoyae TaxID=47428 RepID=A0A284SCY5_ARMOS|nr:uncharacterized protein ARMOST_22474 [Armillaria ostoyae]